MDQLNYESKRSGEADPDVALAKALGQWPPAPSPRDRTRRKIDPAKVDLKRSVSRRHARLLRADDGFVLTEEVGALNGTFVNGAKLDTGRPQPLQDGDRVSFGTVKLVFRR